MPSRPKLPTIDDLKNLPLGAIVAYAVRCARRVQPLYGRAAGVPNFEQHEAAVERAISIAEDFCLSHDVSVSAYAAAYGARDAADAAEAKDAAKAAAAAARAAAYAFDVPKSAVYDHVLYASRVAAEAVDAAKAAARAAAQPASATTAAACSPDEDESDENDDEDATQDAAARADYDRLLKLNPGAFPKLGQPIDATENGPLGPLWPAGEPDW